MQKLQLDYNRFIFGETSPLLAARSDLAKYPAGCRIMRNFISLLQGPAQRRGGTRFIAQTGNGDKPVVLLDFVFSESQAYIVELGDGYARFFFESVPVKNANGAVYQISTPWAQANLFSEAGLCTIRWVQSGDVVYLVCAGQPPQKLSRYGHLDWRIEALPHWARDEDGLREKARPNPTTVTLWKERLCFGAGQTLFMSQSGAFENFELVTKNIPQVEVYNTTGISIDDPVPGALTIVYPSSIRVEVSFLPNEVAFERKSATTVIARAKEGVDGLTRVGVTVVANPGGVAVTPNSTVGTITIGDRSAATSSVVSFDPVKGEISRDGAADSGYIIRAASTAVATDDPIEINVYSEQMNNIAWLLPSENMLVGTTGGEFSVGKTTTSDPLGPANIQVIAQTSFGSAAIQALRIGQVLLFIQRSGMKLREFIYDAYSENYIAGEVSAAAEHITRGGVTAMAFQSEPLETIWLIRTDGVLLGLTYSKDQDMAAWHRHHLGGDGQVSQLAVIPAAHGGRDELWLSVRREVNGKIVYYLERLEPGHEYGGEQADCFFVDSGLTVKGSGLTAVTGLGHLEGLEVDILADGGVQTRRMVQAGQVTLEFPADIVQVGLPYRSVLETVNLDLEMRDGMAQGRIKRFTQVQLMLIESLGGAIGDLETGALTELEYRLGSTPLDSPPGLFTGLKMVNWPGSYDRQGRIGVVQDAPLPLTLAAIYPAASIENMRS